MKYIVLVLELLLTQSVYAAWLTPEEVEEANARMHARNQGEAVNAPTNAGSTVEDINSRIRARVATERGKAPQVVHAGRKERVRDNGSRARKNTMEEDDTDASATPFLRTTDANTATEADLANVASIGPEVAAQIIDARSERRFSGWPDLVRRVIGLGAAQTAFYASTCGLTVGGRSLDGAPPNATLAAAIRQKYQR